MIMSYLEPDDLKSARSVCQSLNTAASFMFFSKWNFMEHDFEVLLCLAHHQKFKHYVRAVHFTVEHYQISEWVRRLRCGSFLTTLSAFSGLREVSLCLIMFGPQGWLALARDSLETGRYFPGLVRPASGAR